MHQGDRSIVEVIPLGGLGKALAYAVPRTLREEVELGRLVRIPLRKRSEMGVISRLGTDQQLPREKLRLIQRMVYAFPVLTPDLFELAAWMKDYYATSAAAVYEALIPAALRREAKPKLNTFLKLGQHVDEAAFAALQRRAPKQALLYTFLKAQSRPILRSTVLSRLKLSPTTCTALIRKGWVVEVVQRQERVAYDDALSKSEAVVSVDFALTPEQASAVEDLEESLNAGCFKVHLLHGVTGSGKTEVYIQTALKVLQQGGGLIFLVPEVALTSQTVGRLRTRFEKLGVKTVVWHSHLSEGERLDAWRSLACGEARIVVGARSAVFAPVRNLKLIIVDEEHEPAYKQEDSPRYHGRDVAVYRSMLCNALCIVGSATPALESLYNVTVDKYRLNTLKSRVDNQRLPTLHVVDMRREAPKNVGSGLSQFLSDKIYDRFERGEQTILFLNRRGYSRSVICPECGYVAQCRHCSLPLTYHRIGEALRCHLCEHQESMLSHCPKCKLPNIRWKGQGTQRVEETVRRLLPRASVVRMDADAMSKKNLFRSILADFRLGKINVLVGTQMIAKGFDFPNVTLVGIVDADLSLHVPDFRASERTFQLLVQVAGRAGRGDRAGEVVVQTFTPHSPPIQFARRADFEGFLSEELAQRKSFNYPPYCHLVRHLFRGKNPEKVVFFAEQWARRLEAAIGEAIEIRGPAPAPVEKLKDEYRFQIWYFMGSVSQLLPKVLDLRKAFPMDKDVIDVFDVDAVNLS